MQETDNQPQAVPESDAEVFRGLRSLALQSISLTVKDAEAIQVKLNNSKTKPKKDFYHKKLSKVKARFQDEVARLVQIEHTMKLNDIPFEAPEVTDEHVSDN